ncbi:MAG: DUF1287 domain-containing protein [Flavobacteriales bacterium]|nr:DUF1287 domain-containing protein [Flavobacteriales bacterium]
MRTSLLLWMMLLVGLFSSCQDETSVSEPEEHAEKVANTAYSILDANIEYDPSYYSIPYPNGDIPKDKGVCTDVVIRTYRKLGIDLQELVHLDMKDNFHVYPKNWGLNRTDTNIDHRRVPNLMKFFSRHGQVKRITERLSDYHVGDIVAWDLGNGITHIGIVSNIKDEKGRSKIIHNIGSGQVLEDVLFRWKVIGHYAY